MSELVLVRCDNCHKDTVVDLKQKTHPNKILETYFKCEHCFYHYTSYVTDGWVRKQQKKMNTMRKDSVEAIDLLDEKREKVMQHMNSLKYNLINYGRADL